MVGVRRYASGGLRRGARVYPADAIRIIYLRSRHNARAVPLTKIWTCIRLTQLRRWARRGVLFIVVDPDTGQDVTRVLLA